MFARLEMSIKKTPFRKVSWIARMLMIIFIMLITWYTYLTFFSDSHGVLIFEDILFYFLPSVVMLTILRIGWKHEKFEGIAILLVSFVFLGIYHVYLSLTAFFFLLFTGTLFLIDDYKINHR